MPPRLLPWEAELQFTGTGSGRALLFGGFGAGPENLRPLATRLQAAGVSVLVSALGRHTGDVDLFHRSRTWHYFADATRLLRRFTADDQTPILLGGYSTGALVALLLAARHPGKVAGLVLVSPVLRTARTATQLVGYSFGSLYYLGLPLAAVGATAALVVSARRMGWRQRRNLWRSLGTAAIFGTSAMALRSITVPLRGGGPMEVAGEMVVPAHFDRASLLTGSTLVPLQVFARRGLADVTVPTLVLFGSEDDVVDVRFGAALAGRVRHAEVRVIPGAPHRACAVPECLDAVEEFARRVLSAGATAGPLEGAAPPAPTASAESR